MYTNKLNYPVAMNRYLKIKKLFRLNRLPWWLRQWRSACNAGNLGSIPGLGRSPEKGMATHSSILAWRFQWTGKPAVLQSVGLQRVGHNLANTQQVEFSHLISTVYLFPTFQNGWNWGKESLSNLLIKWQIWDSHSGSQTLESILMYIMSVLYNTHKHS